MVHFIFWMKVGNAFVFFFSMFFQRISQKTRIVTVTRVKESLSEK